MQKKDVSNLIKWITPYVIGGIVGIVISIVILLSSGCFIETKEVINPPTMDFITGEIVLSNSTITGFSDAGNSVINTLSGIMIGLGIVWILLMLIDIFYFRKRDGV